MAQEYEPFEIQVDERVGNIYPVTARFQGSSSDTIPAELPLLEEREIQQAMRWLERGFIDHDYAKDFGSRLFQTLFSGTIRERFREAYERVSPEKGLRIVLALPQALADLPWEFMYDREGVHGFLARSTTAPLVRHFTDLPLPHQLPKKGPLRVLIVTASPRGYPPVSSEREVEKITRELDRRRMSIWEMLGIVGRHLFRIHSPQGLLQRLRRRNLVEIDVLPHATRQSLQGHLIQARNAGQSYHVVHFIGHGQADESGGRLLLEDEDGGASPVQADEFAEIIAELTVNLVVLNACETASAMSLFQGVAQATLRRGVPAVIGMQVPVLDREAVEFAREFYGAWAAGEPIEAALAYARRLISKETRGAAADWGIPVLYMGPVAGLTPQMEAPPFRWPLLVRAPKWAIATFFALLAAVSALLGIPDINRQLRTEVPVIRCVFPYPMESKYNLNVVVTEFTVLDEDGSPVRSRDGRELADFLFHRLDSSLDELDLKESYEIRPPAHTCPIKGGAREEREDAASALAERIDAHIIIYGVVKQADDDSRFAPEFYISYKGFEGAEGGEEITGQHELGRPLPVTLPFDADQFQGVENPALSARAEALGLITIGLSYYATDDYKRALDYFVKAENTEGWVRTAGKEVVYVLLGNASAGLTSKAKSTEYLTTTREYYDRALDIDPTYARAKVGQAGVLYIMALGDPSVLSWDTVDLGMLDEAAAAYEAALNLGDPPESANIETKVHFGLGQIYFVRAMVVGGDWLVQAEAEFEQVVEAYESGNTRIMNYAGHAYARLGAIARLRGDIDAAVEDYTRATELVSPYYQAHYYTRLGEVYAAVCQTDRAAAAYEEAIWVAEKFGEDESVEKYSARLNDLQLGGQDRTRCTKRFFLPGLTPTVPEWTPAAPPFIQPAGRPRD
jgi:tetratricopeptide (TPR) repeat protein